MKKPHKAPGPVLFGDLRVAWLQAFVQASRSGKRMAAASDLGISQSDLTKYIANLEQWLGRPLVQTGTTALHLGGEDFLAIAEQVLALLEEAQKKPVPIDVPRISGADIQIP